MTVSATDIDKSWSVHPKAVDSEVGDETVILHLENGNYFGLDEVGSLVWSALKQGRSMRGICSEIAARYEVEPGVVEHDVQVLLQELHDQGLVQCGATQ